MLRLGLQTGLNHKRRSVVSAAPPDVDVPVPYRYWRLYITAIDSGNIVTMAEVIYRESLGGAAVTGGTASASSIYDGGFVAANARDANAATSWGSSNTSGPWWHKVDFGAGNDKAITHCDIQAQDTFGFYSSPVTFKMQHSDDDSAWTDAIVIVGDSGWANSEIRQYGPDGRIV